jgi:hypothetical protein
MQYTSHTGVQLKRYARMFFVEKAIVCLILLLSVSTSNADDWPTSVHEKGATSKTGPNLWVNAGMISYHFNREISHRDLNWGYGVQLFLSDSVSVLGGNFINSKYVRSNYAALAWQPLTWHSVRMGFEVGALDGYPNIHNGKYFFAAMPCLSIRNELVGLNIILVPYYGNNMHSSAITAQFIMRVW